MTDEEMAEEYEEKAECVEGKDINVPIKWHDLRKNPDDLPSKYKVVLNQDGDKTTYDPKRGFLGIEGIGVIAWCEIPTYTEE